MRDEVPVAKLTFSDNVSFAKAAPAYCCTRELEMQERPYWYTLEYAACHCGELTATHGQLYGSISCTNAYLAHYSSLQIGWYKPLVRARSSVCAAYRPFRGKVQSL